jgi:hypothetical protein
MIMPFAYTVSLATVTLVLIAVWKTRSTTDSQGYLKSSERELSAFSDQRSAFEAAQ